MKTKNTMLNFTNVTQKVYNEVVSPDRQRLIFYLLKSEDLGYIRLYCEDFKIFMYVVSEKIFFKLIFF